MQLIPLLKDLHTCVWCENTKQNSGMILRQLASTNTTKQKLEHVEIKRSDVST